MPRQCNCDVFSRPEGSDHMPWCEWFKPEPPVQPQRPSTADVLREITGDGRVPCPACGATSGCLHGIPAAIGTSEEFPLTSRPGEYLGQPRALVVSDREAQLVADLISAIWQSVLNEPPAIDMDKIRGAIDRYTAGIYDQIIDELTARQRVHTKRLGH